ncbi:MAG: GvpL/GvpF family gas vesicle protein [Acidobacteria bacterium]|nr:GvpL/GvpF family gas vesicle protein [Acidobacteriota bacterium]
MLYCYFIARSQPAIENLAYRTLQAAPLEFVRYQELVAAVRSLPPGTRSSPQLMLEHGAVLAAAWKRATVLPLRFGAGFRTQAAVLNLLAERGAELLAALERLEGKAEMGLRINILEPGNAPAWAAQIAEICQPLESWVEVRPTQAGSAVLELAHLIYRQDAADYRQRLEPHAVEVAGPRPPFHFLPQCLRIPVQTERRSGRARRAAAAG